MAAETITEIIAVEKDIQARITEEEGKIARWLAEQEAGLAQEWARGVEALQREQAEAEELTLARTRERATAILAAAELEANRCQALPQEELEPLVRRHLRKILPG